MKNEESEREHASSSRMKLSRNYNQKPVSKLAKYETNIENYQTNQKFSIERVDPKGISASTIFASFSGVIEGAEMFERVGDDLQASYTVIFGQEWHDQTPEVHDTDGSSNFCEVKNGKVVFGLGFDCLVGCLYIQSWPQLIMKFKGFNAWGQLVTRGYAQVHLPTHPGFITKKAYIYAIIQQQKWYHGWLPFLEPTVLDIDPKQFDGLLAKGENRQSEKSNALEQQQQEAKFCSEITKDLAINEK